MYLIKITIYNVLKQSTFNILSESFDERCIYSTTVYYIPITDVCQTEWWLLL